jgi:hypothetical protein
MKILHRFTVIAMVLGAIYGSGPAWAQNLKVDSQQPQLLLAAASTATLQKELDQAGALGFRVTLGTTRGSSEIVLVLERDVRSTEKLQYKLIATNATNTFQKEISDAAGQGFRAISRTFLNKPSGLSDQVVVVMERSPNTTKRYEYKLLAANQTSTLESEWVVAMSQGYKAVGMITRMEVMLLTEREAK